MVCKTAWSWFKTSCSFSFMGSCEWQALSSMFSINKCNIIHISVKLKKQHSVLIILIALLQVIFTTVLSWVWSNVSKGNHNKSPSNDNLWLNFFELEYLSSEADSANQEWLFSRSIMVARNVEKVETGHLTLLWLTKDQYLLTYQGSECWDVLGTSLPVYATLHWENASMSKPLQAILSPEPSLHNLENLWNFLICLSCHLHLPELKLLVTAHKLPVWKWGEVSSILDNYRIVCLNGFLIDVNAKRLNNYYTKNTWSVWCHYYRNDFSSMVWIQCLALI